MLRQLPQRLDFWTLTTTSIYISIWRALKTVVEYCIFDYPCVHSSRALNFALSFTVILRLYILLIVFIFKSQIS